jgi:hypothetical protein
LVVDYRRVNTKTKRAIYFVRRLEEVKGDASGSAFLSFLDAVAGFNQVVNTPRAKEMLAILSRSGCWLPTCLMFGPHNGPEDFFYVVDRLFTGSRRARGRFCRTWLAYVDDLTVRSGRYVEGKLVTDEEHAARTRQAGKSGRPDLQSLEEALREVGFDFEQDKLGVERPDGKKETST